VDGVLINIHKILIDVYNRRYNKNITVGDIDRWNYFPKKIFKKIYSETVKLIDNYCLLDSFAPYYMFLFNDKHNVNILTHQGNIKKRLEECLWRLGIRKGFEYIKIIKPQYKRKKMDYEFDIIIDDCPILIDDIQNYTKRYLLLYDSPWNQSYDCDLYRNIFRVYNFKDVANHIEQLEKMIDY